MNWKDYLSLEEEKILPWTGGKNLFLGPMKWTIKGMNPPEHGWYRFLVDNARTARITRCAESNQDCLSYQILTGYLVGDRLISDSIQSFDNPTKIVFSSRKINLIPSGLERFSRIVAGSTHEGGVSIFKEESFPLGPESEVLNAFLNQAKSVDHIKGVTPSLDAAFKFETYQRQKVQERRIELERLRQVEEEKRLLEEKRQQAVQSIGTSVGRRQTAIYDFESAAKAALSVGGAEYLDHSKSYRSNEYVVKFKLQGRKFECVCDLNLKILDSGICLTDEETGDKFDHLFTLESLPSVIIEAINDDKLVVFRHVY